MAPTFSLYAARPLPVPQIPARILPKPWTKIPAIHYVIEKKNYVDDAGKVSSSSVLSQLISTQGSLICYILSYLFKTLMNKIDTPRYHWIWAYFDTIIILKAQTQIFIKLWFWLSYCFIYQTLSDKCNLWFGQMNKAWLLVWVSPLLMACGGGEGQPVTLAHA